MSEAGNEGAPMSGGLGATHRCGHEEGISGATADESRTKIEWAFSHHAQGWNVIPAHNLTVGGRCTCGRKDCGSPAKHPRIDWSEYGNRRSTEAEIREWWTRWPNANIAALTGETSGRVVVDVDGAQGWASLADAGIDLPDTPTVETGREDAAHLHFRSLTSRRTVSKAGILSKVDVRADGGIIMLPGSDHASGRVYRWKSGLSPADVIEADTPDSIVALATPKPVAAMTPRIRRVGAKATSDAPSYFQVALDSECERVRSAAEGERNDILNVSAFSIGTLVGAGMDEDSAVQALFDAGLACGLGADEVERTIRSGMEAGIGRPRDLAPRCASDVPGDLPEYPLHVLPDPIRRFVEEAASCVGCPVDMVAVPLLGYAAATIGRSYRIQIKPGYEKHPVFWFVTVGAPGSGKSPADALSRSFVERLQSDAYAAWEAAHREWRTEHADWKERRRSNKGGGRVQVAGSSFSTDPEPVEPVLEHFFTTDSTIEALAPMVASSAGVAGAYDEIVGWVKSMDAYTGNSGRERTQHLSLWAERSLKVDRRSRPPLFIEKPVVVIVGGIQPDVLRDLAGEAGKRDGFVDRFLWSWPATGPVPWSEASVGAATAAGVERVFARLRPTTPSGQPTVLSDEASAFWREWYDANNATTTAEHGVMAGIHAKADVHLARFALLLHVLANEDPVGTCVSRETMEGAAELVGYHLQHARAVVARLDNAAGQPARGRGTTLRQRITAILRACDGWILSSELGVGLGGHVSAEERDVELGRMLDEGIVEHRIKAPGDTGGRAGAQWRLASTSEVETPWCSAA